MENKLEKVTRLYEETLADMSGNWTNWASFLTTAARLYKYPFDEQVMIYAQRPDATACASFDLWNDRMGRYIRRGSAGIALVDSTAGTPHLHYVFDIADTATLRHSRSPWVWELDERHADAVSTMLAEEYGAQSGNLAQQLSDAAERLSEERWANDKEDILTSVDGSFLEGYDEDTRVRRQPVNLSRHEPGNHAPGAPA